MIRRSFAALTIACAILASQVHGAATTEGMKKGTPEIKSAGPIAFGPAGVLLAGDSASGTIFAIDTQDTKEGAAKEAKLSIDKLDSEIASLLGTKADEIAVADMKVNPISKNIYLSVSRGKGMTATPVFIKVSLEGKLSLFETKDVLFSSVTIPNANAKNRTESITSIGFVKDRVIVSGLSNEEFASKLRTIPFPFKEADKGTSVEIFHGAHGRLETNAPVRTFTLYDINGETNVLAAYTCTPLVKFSVKDLKSGEKVKGTTVAELGNRNKPLDMIVYTKDGKDYVLMANSARGVMKIKTEGIDKIQAITTPVKTETAGLSYEKVTDLKNVVQLDKLSNEQAVILTKDEAGMKLAAIPMP